MTPKIAKIDVDFDGVVVAIQALDAPDDMPDLSGFMPTLIEALQTKKGAQGKPVIYLDKTGTWLEVLVENGNVRAYRSLGGVTDKAEAITRALFLQGMHAKALETNDATALEALAQMEIPCTDNGELDFTRILAASDMPFVPPEVAQSLDAVIEVLVGATLAKCKDHHAQMLDLVVAALPESEDKAKLQAFAIAVHGAFDKLLESVDPHLNTLVREVVTARDKAKAMAESADKVKH